MGRRYLSLALLTEVASDQYFLLPLIDRQIAALAHETPIGFDYSGVVAGECFTVAQRDTVAREVSDLLPYDIVLIHHDHNERGKVDAIRERFADDAFRIVALVPVRETEAWMLADPEALREASPTSGSTWEVPYDVEKVADPKAVLNAALGGRRDAERDFGTLGQAVALDALWKVPGYRRWIAELRTALERLRFLRPGPSGARTYHAALDHPACTTKARLRRKKAGHGLRRERSATARSGSPSPFPSPPACVRTGPCACGPS